MIELNGWAGSATGVIRRASHQGRAGTFYWSVNADSSLILAENGRILCSVEALHIELPLEDEFFDEGCLGENPRVLATLVAGLDFETDWVASALTVIERFTGVVVPDEVWLMDGTYNTSLALIPGPTDEDYEYSAAALEMQALAEQGLDYTFPGEEPDPEVVESDTFPAPVPGRGTVWAWGERWGGALGDGVTTRAYRPIAVTGLDQVTALFAGNGSTFALRADGTLWAWGTNEDGQLGIGHKNPVLAPTLVPGLVGIRSVVTGYESTYGITVAGQVWAWGKAFRGTLGDGKTKKSTTPIPLPALDGVQTIVSQGATTYAINDSGEVWAWGDGERGVLGDGLDHKYPLKAPQQISGLPQIATIHFAQAAVVARCGDGSVMIWGGEYRAADDTGQSSTRIRPPAAIPGLTDVIAVSDGCALKRDGTVWVWRQQVHTQTWDDDFYTPDSTSEDADDAEPEEYGFAPRPRQQSEAERAELLRMLRDQHRWVSSDHTEHPPEHSDQAQGDEVEFTLHTYPTAIHGVDIVQGSQDSHESKQITAAWERDRLRDYFPRPDGTHTNHSYTGNLRAFQVPGLDNITAISCGKRFHALRGDGTVWSWGPGMWQGPDLPSLPGDRIPVQVPGLANIIALANSGIQVALAADGTIWTWQNGGTTTGGDGNGRPEPRDAPYPPTPGTKVEGLSAIKQFVCDSSAVYALLH